MATSLQVFYNLGSLQGTVTKQVEQCCDQFEDAVRSAVDLNAISQQHSQKGAPGKASLSFVGNTAAYRATLWTNMEKLMDNMYSACVQVRTVLLVDLGFVS